MNYESKNPLEAFGTFAEWMVSILIVVTVIITMVLFLNYNMQNAEDDFTVSDNVYCPSVSKIVKGDGVFTFDRTTAMSLRKVDVVSVEDRYIYTKSGNVFSMHDCMIKNDNR